MSIKSSERNFARHIDLLARDFSTLPVPARLLVEHLATNIAEATAI